MILIDTSAWIDYLRDADTDVARELQSLIEDGADLAARTARLQIDARLTASGTDWPGRRSARA